MTALGSKGIVFADVRALRYQVAQRRRVMQADGPVHVNEGSELVVSTPQTSDDCRLLASFLSKAADRWTLLIVRVLGGGPRRFNALQRDIGEVSHKMLASTLRDMEENGLVARTVTPSVPPQVEYALTPLGRDFLVPVSSMADWVLANGARIEAARGAYADHRTKTD